MRHVFLMPFLYWTWLEINSAPSKILQTLLNSRTTRLGSFRTACLPVWVCFWSQVQFRGLFVTFRWTFAWHSDLRLEFCPQIGKCRSICHSIGSLRAVMRDPVHDLCQSIILLRLLQINSSSTSFTGAGSNCVRIALSRRTHPRKSPCQQSFIS